MKHIKYFLLFIISGILLSSTSCKRDGNNNLPLLPLLSTLSNNRIIVLLKGTYATDEPLSMNEINNNALFVDVDEPDTIAAGAPSYSSLPFYLDIGEIRLSSKVAPPLTIDTSAKSKAYWDVVSPYRQVYCSQPYSLNFELDSCYKTGGIVNYTEFMNGRGALYPSVDVGAATYLHAGVYMRAVLTGYSTINGVPNVVNFDNNSVSGQNIITLLNYDPENSQAEIQILPPQFFPLHHEVVIGQQTTMNIDNNSYRPTILEIRFNMKENMMLHNFRDSQNNLHAVVAFSDWRKNHFGQHYIGGNVLTRARVIYPDISTNVRITGGTTSNKHYYALYVANECNDGTRISCNKDKDQLPYAATPVRNGSSTLSAVMQGTYILQCRYDEVYDGFPEKVLSEKIIEVPYGPASVSFDCACGASTTVGCP